MMSRQTVDEDTGSCDSLRGKLHSVSDRREQTRDDRLQHTALVFRNIKICDV